MEEYYGAVHAFRKVPWPRIVVAVTKIVNEHHRLVVVARFEDFGHFRAHVSLTLLPQLRGLVPPQPLTSQLRKSKKRRWIDIDTGRD